jgi:hypothetical protein
LTEGTGRFYVADDPTVEKAKKEAAEGLFNDATVGCGLCATAGLGSGLVWAGLTRGFLAALVVAPGVAILSGLVGGVAGILCGIPAANRAVREAKKGEVNP